MKTCDEAFEEWINGPMWNRGESRYDWAIKGAKKETFRNDLWWAFSAGWAARYQNLTYKDL